MTRRPGEIIPVEVIKIGGSLLSRPDFVSAMRRTLADESDRSQHVHQVFVVGGGPFVDALRTLDATSPVSESITHWLAIELMDVAARWVSEQLPALTLVENYDELQRRCTSCGRSLFLVSHFLRNGEPSLSGRRLVLGWSVTSDSISARLAHCLDAVCLRLLKSRSPTDSERSNCRVASEQGLVDGCFPYYAEGLAAVEYLTL